MRNLLFIIAVALTIASCETEPKQESNKEQTSYKDALNRMNVSSSHTVKVVEAITSGTYTYVKLNEDGREFWAAISARPIETGATYYYKDAFEMKDFQSKSLNRVFESIWFINEFYTEKPETQTANKSHKTNNTESKPKKSAAIDPVEGGYSLSEIFKGKNELQNQEIIVRGEVVKINPNIMKTNWVHIQDGTSYNGVYDLTITLNEEISFKVGDVVTFKGKLILNKDFGSGYKYDYLLDMALKQ